MQRPAGFFLRLTVRSAGTYPLRVMCPACGVENRPGRRFCGKCGTALAIACAACGAINDADESYCGECGAKLGATSTDRSRVLSATGGAASPEVDAARPASER